jgi:hypothetical protein
MVGECSTTLISTYHLRPGFSSVLFAPAYITRTLFKFIDLKQNQPVLPQKSRDSSVGIALGYGLDDRGSRVRFPAGLGIFLFTTA